MPFKGHYNGCMGLADLLDFSPWNGIRRLPDIDDHNESNVPGLYVVGDLANAPVIKMAFAQGATVARHVYQTLGAHSAATDVFDVVVIGAGPAGIGAGLALQDLGANFAILERQRPFSTIENFPKGKLIFSEPSDVPAPPDLWFEDAPKEALVARWDSFLRQQALPIIHPVDVTHISRDQGLLTVHVRGEDDEEPTCFRAHRVILATGKRGQPRALSVPGASLPHVHHSLHDPSVHRGENVLVVGGGDSAVESAVALAEHGAKVTLSYRSAHIHRPRHANQQRLQQLVEDERISLRLESTVIHIDPTTVTLKHGGQTETQPFSQVYVHIGNQLPKAFLHRSGIHTQGEVTARRWAWMMGFAALIYVFYVLKSGVNEVQGAWVSKVALFPFRHTDPLGWLPGALRTDLGFRVVDGAFWCTTIYALLILVFGIRAWRKYPSSTQRRRYISLIAFQWIFLFGIPELLAPLVISVGGEGGLGWTVFGGDRAWKFYALSVPWPLNIWALIDAPGWSQTGQWHVVAIWLALAALTTFVALPLYIRNNGQRFCAYLCGCGGLAETLGDFWRHLAPRGRTAQQSEVLGRFIFLLAIPTTLLIGIDAWGLLHNGALLDAKAFAQHWYPLMVDFWLASVLGVAAYPYFGNRVWCRFMCPLRAYMEEVSRRISRIAIQSDDRCIGCGDCTRACQMGIDVQRFAQHQLPIDNGNSACIQCGICVEVCPMDVLNVQHGKPVSINEQPWYTPPAAPWHRTP